MNRRRICLLAATLLMALTACGGSSQGSARPTASTSPSSPAFVLPSPSLLDPDVPLTQAYRTTDFRPAMTLKIPADWFPTERDEAALQVFTEGETNEITFDHTYTRKESVATAIARLKKTEGLVPGPVTAVTMGGRRGLAFVSTGDESLIFTDSTFHVPGGDIEVMALPVADGTTLTVFVYSGPNRTRPLEPTRRLARRVLATVVWR